MDGTEDDFTTELRTRTRQAHRASNAAVTLTAPLALSSRAVYRLGLKAFYYVYQAMEAELERRRVDCHAVASMYFPELRRAPAFERDLAFYYGPSWRATMGPPSRATTKYLEELRRSVDENPLRLVAWCHTMYSAMFAGGQILRSWFKKAFRLQGLDGTRAYDLSETIPDREQFQKRYNCALNDLDLSRDDKETIFKQRLEIFHLNSTLFEEIRESTEYKARVRKCLLVIVLLLLALYVLYALAKSR